LLELDDSSASLPLFETLWISRVDSALGFFTEISALIELKPSRESAARGLGVFCLRAVACFESCVDTACCRLVRGFPSKINLTPSGMKNNPTTIAPARIVKPIARGVNPKNLVSSKFAMDYSL
jgi:hypothetical protein